MKQRFISTDERKTVDTCANYLPKKQTRGQVFQSSNIVGGLGLEYASALDHVASRGDRREAIFHDDKESVGLAERLLSGVFPFQLAVSGCVIVLALVYKAAAIPVLLFRTVHY